MLRILLSLIFLVITLTSVKAQIPLSYNGKRTYTSEKIFDREVVLYPGALLQTSSGGKLIFTKRLTVFGDFQVFATNADVDFLPHTLSELNPCWFGARGDDDIDDTPAFLKVLQIARQYEGSINIRIPLGKFLINQTLEIGNNVPSSKSINLVGYSMSGNSLSGSSLRWNGAPNGVLIRLKNYSVGRIENIDFSKAGENLLKHNIELVPFDYQIEFENCSFAGCGGTGSANVNLNAGNNLQVSEINFENCVFRGETPDGANWLTESAIIGGLANTKDFYFRFCSFAGYTQGAINLEVADILNIENCTFAHNITDIICLVCNTLATSNYSENSKAFFKSTVSQNVSFTTLMNNIIYGTIGNDYLISGGGGNLVMINNNLGGMGGEDVLNKIRWDSGKFSNVYSVGNFYRHGQPMSMPFEFTGQTVVLPLASFGDLIGKTSEDIKPAKLNPSDNN